MREFLLLALGLAALLAASCRAAGAAGAAGDGPPAPPAPPAPLAPPAPPGGAFNLRILSDSVPDWSSRENFVRSALSGWETDHEKALAQFRWSYLSRRVGSAWYDHGRAVHDPVLFFNSYGMTMCGNISSINVALWEAAGWKGRTVDVHDHVVAEVFYDDAWHAFDNDFCNYFLDEKGEVAGGEELHNGRVREEGKHYLFDHCPHASCPGGRIYMGPSSWALEGVARDWWDVYRPRLSLSCAQAGHRYILGIRPDESYTRDWKPLGLGPRYSRPHRGKDPVAKGSTPLMNCRANGRWEWRPDLADPSILFASRNVRCGKGGIVACTPGKPAWAVFRVAAANVITSVELEAGVHGDVQLSVSGNEGLSWSPLSLHPEQEGMARGRIAEPVGGRLEYMVKAELGRDGRLREINLNTITQVNPRALPSLRLGKNDIAAVSDEHLQHLTFYPRLSDDQHTKEVYRATNWQSLRNPRTKELSIRGTGPCELVFKASAPRDIRHVRMACTAHLTEPGAELAASVSFDGGRTWRTLGSEKFGGAPYDARPSFETRKVPRGAREVLLRYAFPRGGGGLVDVFAEIGYRPAGPRMSYDVTYSWSEWRDGNWFERRHVERVTGAHHRYAVNVGGSRPPRMNWVRISPAGGEKPGYSDGEDVEGECARPAQRLSYGKKISDGCKYTVDRGASAAFPDVEGKTLTDGYVGLASYWGLGGVNLTGKKNRKRVGQLVVWEPGEEVVVTVDLGKPQRVGGARICAVQPNEKVLYPALMTVEVSLDGEEFAEAGRAGWEECFFPTADFLHWEGFDSPIYDGLPAGGRTDFKFPVLFEKATQARYIRFRLFAPEGGGAGIGLWEVEVYDWIKRSPWSDNIRPPAGATKR